MRVDEIGDLLARVAQVRAGAGRKASADRPPDGGAWCSIQQAAGSDVAEVSIYGPIGRWDVSARDFAAQLSQIKASRIMLRVNSPGGDVFDALAIYNALKRHKAKVTATVDGLAASAASFIVQAADDRQAATSSMMMIHNAWGLAIGDAAELRAQADLLDKASAMVAGIYARRSGRDVEEFSAAMDAETWYSGQEAADAGLVDGLTDPAAPDEDGESSATSSAAAGWDLSMFRGFTPPVTPPAPAAQQTAPPPAPDPAPARKQTAPADIRAALKEAFK